MNIVPLMVSAAEETPGTGLQWWFWLILIIVIVLIFLWLWLSGRKSTAEIAPEEHKEKEVVEELPTKAVLPAKADDLIIVEGIGPKINKVLHDAGITTFADLAGANVEDLKKILLDAGLRLADPTTWPQQAALARDGKMDELQKLQDNLKAGRA